VARALLESAVSAGPTNTECDALWSSLAGKLPQAVVAGAAAGTAGAALAKAATSKALGVGLFVKSAVVVAVMGSVAAVGLARPWESRGEAGDHAVASASAARPRPVVVASASAPVALPSSPVVAEESPLPSAPVPPSAPAPRPSAARRAPSNAVETAPAAPLPAEETALQSESASLLRGRQLLRSGDCDGALAQLRETGARFPRGGLAQEREVLSIEALACSGRATEASARAETFVRDYPTSPHASTVRRFTR
jgi:hypothetical protein